MFSDLDLHYMQRALELAQHAIGLSDPNPRVGCVLVTPTEQLIEGHTQVAGGAHAEANAIAQAQQQGIALAGATAYVTLEPCSHTGRTPPCANALIAAGIKRVVVALVDPNPLVSGQGIERLRSAGLQVEVGLLADAAKELNIGFFSRMIRQQPWVRLKVAASLDGHTALPNGASQWITGPDARRDGHFWRARANAILTGIGTVLADNPRLDVRHVEIRHTPLRVILDSRLRTPPTARILQAPGKCLIITSPQAALDLSGLKRQQALLQAGAELLEIPVAASLGGAETHLNLQAVLAVLHQRGINELHIEAGATLNGAFMQAGLVDEYLIYLAPKLLGTGLGMWQLPVFTNLAKTPTLHFNNIQLVGSDLRLIARTQPPPLQWRDANITYP